MPPDEPQTPPSDGPAAEGQALGFAEPPRTKPERYNTQFLVANFEKQQQRTRLMVIGGAILIVLGGVLAFAFTAHPELTPTAAAPGEPASGTPKAEAPKAPAAEAGAKAEAPKPAGEPAQKAEAPKPAGAPTAADTPK